jgi:hypothetical protein
MAVPSMRFAELSLAIGGLCGDKNRRNRWRGSGRRLCIINTIGRPRSYLIIGEFKFKRTSTRTEAKECGALKAVLLGYFIKKANGNRYDR